MREDRLLAPAFIAGTLDPATYAPLRKTFPYLILVGAVFAAYSNAYGNAFLYDDTILIINNRFLRSWHYLPSLFVTNLTAGDGNIASPYYRPLQNLFYMIVFQIAGLSLFAFHFANIALHAANACLVYLLGRKFNFQPAALLPAVLLWALHPLQVEAVTYMSATADTLSACFCLLGMIVLVPDFTPRRIFAAAALMICALLSKEAAICFPFLAMSGLYFFSEERFRARTYLRLWPLLLAAAIYIAVHLAVWLAVPAMAHANIGTTAPFANYAPFMALALYAQWLAWPVGLHMEHDLPSHLTSLWNPYLGTGFALTVLMAMQVLRRQSERSLPFSWGLCWFVAALWPVFGINNMIYEHWMYLPLAGFMLGAGQSLCLWLKHKSPISAAPAACVAVTAALAATLALGILTYRQNEIWRDPETFYDNIINHGERAPKIHAALGALYANRGAYDKAVEQYRTALANGGDNRLPPGDIAFIQSNWGATLLKMPDGAQRMPEAMEHFNVALQISRQTAPFPPKINAPLNPGVSP